MSSYISFYLKSSRKGNNDYLPFATFSSSNVYYEYAADYVPNYTVCKPLRKVVIKAILEDVREELSKSKNYLDNFEKKLALVTSMNNSVEEKMSVIDDINESIDSVKNLTDELKNCEMFFTMLLWVIEEAECTKYSEDKDDVIDPDDYIYAGIECDLPNDGEEVK